MLNRYRDKSPRVLLTGAISLLLAAVVFSMSAGAAGGAPSDPKAAVVFISQTWLKEIDEGRYQQAYDYTGTWFHHLVTAEEWIPWMVRYSVNLGRCTQRQQAKEVVFKTDPKGQFEGDWAYVEFESSFEKHGDKTQLVVLKKEKDGTWKVAGYSIGDRKA